MHALIFCMNGILGFKKVTLSNLADLEALTMVNTKFCGEIASCVGAKKRKDLITRADALNILIVNRDARLIKSEDE